MELRAGYKNTEVGIIPEDWEVKTLLELCLKIQDGTHFSPKIGGSDFLYITSKNIRFGFLDTSNADSIDTAQHQSIYKRCDVKFGDLLLTKDGANTGNAAINIIKEEFSLLSSVAFLRFDPKKNDANFFLQQILTYSGQSQIREAMSGNAITRLTLEKIKKLCFTLPPTLSEQTAIATALSDADALISSLEKLIAKKRHIKQGAMQKLLQPREGWEVKKLGEIGEFKNGINKGAEDFGFGYPFVNLMDVFGISKIATNQDLGLINANEADRKAYDLKKGDVLFIRSSVKPEGVGLTCLIEEDLDNTVFSGFIIRFRDNGNLSDKFKEYCFSSSYFRNRVIASSSVSANTNINQDSLKNLVLHFPKSKSEQTRIATILSDMDNEITALEAKLEKYRKVKLGMMQNLLTGKIRLV